MAIRVTVSSLAGNELCQVEVPGSMRASDLRQRIGHELGLNPYTFKLIGSSGMDGSGAVSSLAFGGCMDLTLVKLDGPTPDAQGYVQLQSTGAAAPAGSSCSGLQMALVALLLAALAIYFVPYPYGLLLCYAAYLLEALCFNATAKGLWRLKQTESLLRYIEEMKACKPVLEIKAQCYHMETHVRHVTKKDGTTRRELVEERVDTATFTDRLRVVRWRDLTPDVVEGLNHFPVLQVHFEMRWEAADAATEQAHLAQRERLRQRAAAADSQHDTSEELKLLDAEGKECSFYGDMIGTTGEDLPFWLGFPPYAACCVFGLSWPYRHYFSKRAVRGDFVFEKRVWAAE